MKSVLFSEEALAEYQDLIAEFTGISEELADRFASQVLEFTRLIGQNPHVFHYGRFGVARANLRDGFQRYYLAYIEEPEFLSVVAVGTAERRPYYFKDRLR